MSWKLFDNRGGIHIIRNPNLSIIDSDLNPVINNVNLITLSGLSLSDTGNNSASVTYNTNAISTTITTYPYKSVYNTVSTTSAFEHVIPANSLGTKGHIRFMSKYLLDNANTGVTYYFTYSLYLNDSLKRSAEATVTSSTDGRTYAYFNGVLMSRNSTAEQLLLTSMASASAPSLAGDNISSAYDPKWQWNSATNNTTADVTMKIRVSMSGAHANVGWKLIEAIVEGPFLNN